MTSLSSISPCELATQSGSGRLAVEIVADKSAATLVEARSPLKILVPHPRGESVWAYLSNFGGGLLSGDTIDFSIAVAENARCFLSTQSSTKIYRGSARNLFHAEIAPGALLVYTPDVSQGFANSRYRQKQTIQLADETSNLIFLDWYSSGRAARGERWSFSEHSSRTDIFVADRPVFIDTVRLTDCAEHFARINCVATLVLLGRDIEERAVEYAREISRASISKRADLLEVASAIPGGAVLRFAGISVEAVARRIRARVDFISEKLGDNPFRRKW